jgi:hypothetical protein
LTIIDHAICRYYIYTFITKELLFIAGVKN